MKSVYVHIPFCKTICSYCDFCKMYYNEKFVNDYLDALDKEISGNYKGEVVNTLYVGGGTPNSLNKDELNKLFKILDRINLSDDYEFTIECNIELIEESILKLFKENKVNRISIGIESIDENNLKYLNRNYDKELVLEKINLVKKYFSNINVDLIYALKDETIDVLNKDIDFILDLDVEHISTYSLIIEWLVTSNSRLIKGNYSFQITTLQILAVFLCNINSIKSIGKAML